MREPAHNRGKSKQDYWTDRRFLRAVETWLGVTTWSRDLAASPDNAVCSCYYTAVEDSLSDACPWGGLLGWQWLNPPFAHIQPWVAKARRTVEAAPANIAMLVPAGVGANWWKDEVHQHAYVYFLNGRLTFEGQTQPYKKDCALLLWCTPPDPSRAYDILTWRDYAPPA